MRRLLLVALAASGCGNILGLPEGELVGPRTFDAMPQVPPPDAAKPVRLIVQINAPAPAGGRVRANVGAIDCPGACSGDYPAGMRVNLNATANGGSRFLGWQGAGCTGTDTCMLTLNADTAVTAEFADNSGGHNFVFMTAESWMPSTFNPLTSADAHCMESAAVAGMPGNYVAWLSTAATGARTRLAGARGWVRPDGLPFADTVDDVAQGRIYMPIRMTARGTVIGNSVFAMTATAPSGMVSDVTCNDFTDPGGIARVGDPRATKDQWTSFGAPDFGGPCNQPQRLICFGVDRQAPLAVTPAAGRLAFISSMGWDVGGGIAAADGICRNEAMLAGKSGTFKAVLATTTASAASRFDAGGAPWVRLDGIPLVRPGTPIFDGDLAAPLNVTLGGAYVSGMFVAVGADKPTDTGVAFSTCNDWAGSTGMYIFTFPQHIEWFPFGRGNPSFACNTFPRVFCFQE